MTGMSLESEALSYLGSVNYHLALVRSDDAMLAPSREPQIRLHVAKHVHCTRDIAIDA